MIRPNRILEIGAYTDTIALCMAESLEDNGKLFTIDVNEGRPLLGISKNLMMVLKLNLL